MKRFLASRASRTRLFVRVGFVLALVLLLVFELWFTAFGVRRQTHIDLTAESLYTLSDAMKKECAFLADLKDEQGQTQIVRAVFCSDPDVLVASPTARAVYFTALALQKAYPNFRVETVNITENPTAVAAYRTTSLSAVRATDLILACGERYRIASTTSFWTSDQTSKTLFSYNGEYKMASLLLSLTNISRPAAYFVTDHGETYYNPQDKSCAGSLATAALFDLLTERGLEVKTLDLSAVDAIPADCTLLILNNPRRDFTADPDRFRSLSYVSDTEKIDRYLVKRQGAMMVTKDYRVSLPVLEEFLYEWGFSFGTDQIRDEEASLADAHDTHTTLVASYDADTSGFGYSVYSTFADTSSAPRTVVHESGELRCSFGLSRTVNEPGAANTNKTYHPFLMSSAASRSYAYSALTGTYSDLSGEQSVRDVCAVVSRTALDSKTAEQEVSYVFCAASADFLSTEQLGNTSFANYDILSSLVRNIAFPDSHASSDVGGTSLNSGSFGGKRLISSALSATGSKTYAQDSVTPIKINAPFTTGAQITFTVVVALVPVLILAAGVFVHVRRRYL